MWSSFFYCLNTLGTAKKGRKRKVFMKKEMKYNLQFFAEGEGETGAEVAAQPEVEATPATPSEPDTGNEDTAESENAEPEAEDTGATEESAAPQSAEENARYAAARRDAEAQMRQFKQQQAQIDNQFAQMFGKYKNPVTGQPITNAAQYLEAMQAQERLKMQEQLKSAGVDPQVLDKAIANSPVVQNAQRLQEQFTAQQVQSMVAEDMKAIMRIDPTKQSEQDIVSDPSYGQALAYVQEHPGVRLSDAYKLVNFDRLKSSSIAAAQQAAVNQAKSKQHMKTVSGSAGNDGEVDIPASELAKWQAFFPDKSAKELRATYNRSLRAHKGR